MENNTYDINNEENNINNKNDILLSEENNKSQEGNLFIPIEVENYLNVNILYF